MGDDEVAAAPAGGDDAAFIERILRALDGLLDGEALAAFDAELAADVEKRRLFVRVCLQSRALAEAPGAAGAGASAGEREFLDALAARLAAPGDGPRPRPRARAGAWVAIGAAAGLLAALVLAIAAGALRHGPGRRDVAEAPPPAPPPAADRVGVDDGLAIVVALDGVAWEPGGPAPAAGALLGPGRLRLRAGRLTLAMLTGATIVAEGPADLDLVSPERIFCRRGRLRARAPAGAEGLVIASPGASVLDLGTEFGLSVDGGGASRVRVFAGRVEAMMRSGAGNQNVSYLLGVDEGLRIDPGAAEIRPIGDDAGFAAPPGLPLPPLAPDAAYPGAVLGSRPWGYWRFGSLRDGAVANEVAGRPPLRAVGGVRLAEEPGGNRTAEFPDGRAPQYFTLDGAWAPPTGAGYAVELWFLPERVENAALASLATPSGSNNHALLLEATSRNRHAQHPPGSIRFLDRWPPALSGGYNLYSERTYVPCRWHHLVGQVDGGRMELYLDGEMTSSEPRSLGHPTAPCQVLLGRLTSHPDGERADGHWFYGRAFVGRLDEFALYDRPLSPEEVRAHHALAAGRRGRD